MSSKHTLKYLNKTVPISAYDTFNELQENGVISEKELEQWNAIHRLKN